jgi:sulfocyanin
MKRSYTNGLAALIALGLIACGGGDAGSDTGEAPSAEPAAAPAGESAAMGELSMPDWMTVDETAQTVTIELVAGLTADNNRWNFNGYSSGNGTVVVPAGYTVVMNFRNDDPANYHSVAVLEGSGNWPVTFDNPSPVFAGAMTSNPTSMTEATAPGGGTETITFTASEAGDYSFVCLIPAHAATGMWMGFTVSSTGEVGVRG